MSLAGIGGGIACSPRSVVSSVASTIATCLKPAFSGGVGVDNSTALPFAASPFPLTVGGSGEFGRDSDVVGSIGTVAVGVGRAFSVERESMVLIRSFANNDVRFAGVGRKEGISGRGDVGCPMIRFSETTVSSIPVGALTFFKLDSFECRKRASARRLKDAT